jgi:hypothetical protein
MASSMQACCNKHSKQIEARPSHRSREMLYAEILGGGSDWRSTRVTQYGEGRTGKGQVISGGLGTICIGMRTWASQGIWLYIYLFCRHSQPYCSTCRMHHSRAKAPCALYRIGLCSIRRQDRFPRSNLNCNNTKIVVDLLMS